MGRRAGGAQRHGRTAPRAPCFPALTPQATHCRLLPRGVPSVIWRDSHDAAPPRATPLSALLPALVALIVVVVWRACACASGCGAPYRAALPAAGASGLAVAVAGAAAAPAGLEAPLRLMLVGLRSARGGCSGPYGPALLPGVEWLLALAGSSCSAGLARLSSAPTTPPASCLPAPGLLCVGRAGGAWGGWAGAACLGALPAMHAARRSVWGEPGQAHLLARGLAAGSGLVRVALARGLLFSCTGRRAHMSRRRPAAAAPAARAGPRARLTPPHGNGALRQCRASGARGAAQ